MTDQEVVDMLIRVSIRSCSLEWAIHQLESDHEAWRLIAKSASQANPDFKCRINCTRSRERALVELYLRDCAAKLDHSKWCDIKCHHTFE